MLSWFRSVGLGQDGPRRARTADAANLALCLRFPGQAQGPPVLMPVLPLSGQDGAGPSLALDGGSRATATATSAR